MNIMMMIKKVEGK